MGDVLGAIVVVTGILFGMGASGVAVAWLNDKRTAALKRRAPDLTPRQILERLYAAGEIDDEEFTRRSERLMLDPPLELD